MINFILNILKPLILFVGKIHMPFSRKLITGEHYYNWRDKIDIGTAILTKTNGEFSNLINPMDLKHAGIYVGDVEGTGVCYVLEAVGKGVKLTDLVTFMTTKDIIVIAKPKFIESKEKLTQALTEAIDSFVGLPYDYLFNKDGKAFYCFELVAASLNYYMPELQLKCKEIVKGKKIYDHNTFLDSDNFEVVIDSRKSL